MILIGIILLILGLCIPRVHVLVPIGGVLLIIGIVFLLFSHAPYTYY